MGDSSGMTQRVRVLYLEDNPQDVELVEATLAAEGIACDLRWVETAARYRQALEQPDLDLILSDYSLPTFDGLAALRLARAQRPELPFIFVSGAMGEERAIESLKQGATDYVLKQRLSQLGPAVRRALQEAAERGARQQAQAALEASEERYRQISETISDYAFSFQVQAGGKVELEWLTDSFTAITGYRVADILGQSDPLRIYADPDDLSRVREVLGRLQPGEATEYEFRIRTRGGEVRWVRSSVRAVANPSGQGMRIYGATQDITERRYAEEKLKQSEVYFRTLTENTSDLIALIERSGVVQYVSPSARHLLGYEERDLIGKSWDAYVSPTDTEATTQFFASICQQSGARQRLEFRVRRRDGEFRVLEGVFTNLLDDPVLCSVVVNARDVTTRRQAEAALQEANERLEQTLAMERLLRSELLRLSEALRRTQETERTRIARELHDGIAQTLSGILLHVDFLLTATGDPALVKTLLNEIKEALAQAVTDIRDVVWDLRPGVLDDLGLVEALQGLVTNLMRRTPVEITLQCPETMPVLSPVIETALYRIVQEALANALQHGQAARATVRVEPDTGRVHLTVMDTGKGFDATTLSSPSTRSARDTIENKRGIGLWSMRARAEEVGGTFALYSTPGHGTTIHVTVPVQSVEQ